MTTILLGANGRLGRMLTRFSHEDAAGWRTQMRSGDADIIWSGDFDDPAVDLVFVTGATLINMIGYTGQDERLLHQINVRFVEEVLAKAARAGVAHVVLASSAAVYGAGCDTPFDEDAALHPLTPYAASKVAMEQVASASARLYDGLAISIARIGNVAGADALTHAAERHIASGTPMPLHRFGDGTAPMRSYIGPRDFFSAIKAISVPDAEPPRPVNVVYPTPVTLDAVLRAYRDHVMPELKWADTPAPDGTPQHVTLSTDRLQHLIGFENYDDPANALGQQVAEYMAL